MVKVQDSQESGLITIHYEDGTKNITLRDKTAPFLEQMQYLGVSNNQMAELHYEMVKSRKLTGEKTMNILVSVAMLGLLGFAMFRLTGGPMAGIRKKYTEGDIPNITFRDVAGMDESRAELESEQRSVRSQVPVAETKRAEASFASSLPLGEISAPPPISKVLQDVYQDETRASN